MTTDIKVREVTIEPGKDDSLEIIYIPDQTQVLHKGLRYRFVVEAGVTRLMEDGC